MSADQQPQPDTSNPLSADYVPTPRPHGTTSLFPTPALNGEGADWISDNEACYGGVWAA